VRGAAWASDSGAAGSGGGGGAAEKGASWGHVLVAAVRVGLCGVAREAVFV